MVNCIHQVMVIHLYIDASNEMKLKKLFRYSSYWTIENPRNQHIELSRKTDQFGAVNADVGNFALQKDLRAPKAIELTHAIIIVDIVKKSAIGKIKILKDRTKTVMRIKRSVNVRDKYL